MESVVATVSGYHGAERFNLIKLISQSGASYVGTMNQAVTHLVCWKFEGRKYELGKKFKTVIVNHRWIEECVKKGRRVSEHPYTFQCGQEMGPLLLDTSKGTTKAGSESKPRTKQHVIDIGCEDTDGAFVIETSLLNEDLSPVVSQNNHGSHRTKRKTIKPSWRDCSSSKSHNLEDSCCLDDLVFSGSMRVEPEESGSSKRAVSNRLKKGKSTSSETVRDCSLVKKHRNMENLGFAGISDQGCQPVQLSSENNGCTTSLNGEIGEDECRNACDERFWSQQNNNEALHCVEETENVKDDSENLCIEHAPSSLLKKPDDHCTAIDEVLDDTSSGLHRSTELSCVICWTDFSSTRGVLPCGHRFCFLCIQTWADCMVSGGKASTCPLCKSSFVSITKVEEAVSSDQKIYSQTIPHDRSKLDAYILLDEVPPLPTNPSVTQVCNQCFSREPVDLLIRCQLCQIQCVHSYCLDPPLFPWTCVHCKDLQILYLQTC